MFSQKHTFCMDMTVLERQQARFKCLQQQQQCNTNYVDQNNSIESCSMPQFQAFFDHTSVKGDMEKPEMYLGTSDLPTYGSLSVAAREFVANKMGFVQAEVEIHSLEIDHCLSRTSSCQIGAVEAAKMEEDLEVVKVTGDDVALVEKMQSSHGRDSLNKRKSKFVAAEECKDKRIKGEVEVESKAKEKSSSEISADSSKDNQKASGVQKPDYIHVRARRGQATDSHSLAERARREKIGKKMKCLQDLVPGCNKIAGRAGMLDEIINYVQSLQRQVEFLSMKLAALNPRLQFNVDNFSSKKFPAHVASFPIATMSAAIANLPYLQFNLQQATGCELEALTNSQIAPERNTSSSAFIPELCPDSSCFSQVQPFWDADSQNLRNMGFHQG